MGLYTELGVLFLLAGAVHSGHTAPLHLLTPRDDPLGAGDLRGPEAPGDAACGRAHPHLGARSPPSLPGQVKPRVRVAPCSPTLTPELESARGRPAPLVEGSLASGDRSRPPPVRDLSAVTALLGYLWT